MTQDVKLQLEEIRHSAQHVLEQAMLKLYPGLKMAMGSITEDGFYFDFDYTRKISESDFGRIEAEMKKIVKKDLRFRKEIVSQDKARELFNGNKYKNELIDEFVAKGKKLLVYWTADNFVDLCLGPHVASTGKIGAFKLLSIAGAYWRGDEKNKMLTRIYGTAFPTQKELDNYLAIRDEAKKRDHRKIGKKMNLFVFSDLVGKGLPLFTSKGSAVRRELERFIIDEELRRGYRHVYTPDIAKVELYEKSGHYPYYKESMYPVMKVDEERLILRPMTCPHHFELYASKPRSYRELPIRIAELAKQYRYEKSGELTGLIRVRMFCLADAHIVCRKDQAETEIDNVLDLIDYLAKILGLKIGENYRYRLSKGDRNDEKKFYKDDSAWDFAEKVLRKALQKRKAPFYEAEGEAAFYGPKIDIQMKNVGGKEDTAFTVQYDFVMPGRFALNYIDVNGKEKEPVVIHRSSIGALERVMAFLIENFAGAFPVWLHPVQVTILPVSERFVSYAKEVISNIKRQMSNIRIELDASDETLANKIRKAQEEKIPYMLIVGEKEEANKTVNLRLRNQKEIGEIKIEEFIKYSQEIITNRSLKLWY